jgi:arylsulfatase A-like enzyme
MAPSTRFRTVPGRLLDHLQAAGKLDNTIVIVTSDNGAESAATELPGIANLALDAIKLIEGFDTSPDSLGQPRSLTAIGPEWASVSSAPFNLYKFYASEGGLRVPLVIAGKNVAVSGIQHAPVHVADLLPTVLDAAGVPYEAGEFYGRSFMPVLSGANTNTYGADDSFAFEVSGNAALYRGNWKITRNSLPRGDSQWRLYDLAIDPGETTDASAKNPDVFQSMLAEYKKYSEEVGVFELGPDEYPIKNLTKNLAMKSFKKYWPHVIVLFFLLSATIYMMFRFVRLTMRWSAR